MLLHDLVYVEIAQSVSHNEYKTIKAGKEENNERSDKYVPEAFAIGAVLQRF